MLKYHGIFKKMDENNRQRSVYVTAKQKKKLIGLVAKHPELINFKVTQDFTYKDSQKLWHMIANECNSIPGARKSWRQWRKTWHDLRSNMKKRQAEIDGELPPSVIMLTPAEQEALGVKNVSSTTNYSHNTEFVPLEQNNDRDSCDDAAGSNSSFSEAESAQEEKVFTEPPQKMANLKNDTIKKSKHSNSCISNCVCNIFAAQELRKIQIKEDYWKFKKDYYRQKIILIKEQNVALRSIAKSLSVDK